MELKLEEKTGVELVNPFYDVERIDLEMTKKAKKVVAVGIQAILILLLREILNF